MAGLPGATRPIEIREMLAATRPAVTERCGYRTPSSTRSGTAATDETRSRHTYPSLSPSLFLVGVALTASKVSLLQNSGLGRTDTRTERDGRTGKGGGVGKGDGEGG